MVANVQICRVDNLWLSEHLMSSRRRVERQCKGHFTFLGDALGGWRCPHTARYHGEVGSKEWLRSLLPPRLRCLMLASTAAEAKASKAAVHYRDYPKGMQMCHMCKFYILSSGGRK